MLGSSRQCCGAGGLLVGTTHCLEPLPVKIGRMGILLIHSHLWFQWELHEAFGEFTYLLMYCMTIRHLEMHLWLPEQDWINI